MPSLSALSVNIELPPNASLNSPWRAEISAEAQQILHDDAPIVPLFSPDWVVVSRSNVTGISKGDDEKMRLDLISKN